MSTKTELLRLAMEIEAAEKTAAPAHLTLGHNNVPVDLVLGEVTPTRSGGYNIDVTANIDSVPVWSGAVHVTKSPNGITFKPISSYAFPASFLRILEKNLTSKTWDLLFGSY
jgi:hypothetical protein